MKVGTRGSALALAQAQLIADELGSRLGERIELTVVSTSGDGSAGADDKSRWVDGLEEALVKRQIDLAVHSAKDVPAQLGNGLEILAVPARADARDAICGAASLAALAAGARIGTTSLRRRSLVLAQRGDVEVVDLRGNVDTRLRKLAAGEVDAAILALAGLERLGRADEADAILDGEQFVPAAGQGALALEGRADDDRARAAAAQLSDPPSFRCLLAERALVAELGATCNTPVGAHARAAGADSLELRTYVGMPDGSAWLRDRLQGPAADPEALGRELAA
ncbi:MAG TPA: hydroxymethylbilane synthase, partial [Solirubrobacteraceae bacterium]|nr:hydroxymethylbilane synthase [Solirubrobacteraceae bacterium]